MSVIGAGPVALVGSLLGEQPIQHGLLAAADEPPEHHQLLGNVAGSAQRTNGPKGIHASPGTATLVETSRPGSPSVWPTARAVVMLGDERATLPGSLWTPYLLLSAATAAASVGELDEEPCEATRRDDLQQLGRCVWGIPCRFGRETSSLGHRIAPRGAISMAATPRAKSATSRSPCLVRSSPESSARVEMTCSTTWSVSIVSGSSYVTSM